MNAARVLVAGSALMVLLAQGASAQTARSGGAPNAQLMQQMQQLASERTSLQAENARIRKELEDMRKERDQLKGGQKAVDQRAQASAAAAIARSAAQRDSAEKELADLKGKTEQLIAKFRETVETLRKVETEQTSTTQALLTREQELKTCTEKNAALFTLNEEILGRLEKGSRLAKAEPFTQLKRVQLENMADDYRGKAEDQKLISVPTTPAK